MLVHRTEFSISEGGFFLIPRGVSWYAMIIFGVHTFAVSGNSYQINNLTDIDAMLVFMQAREVAAIVENDIDQGDDA